MDKLIPAMESANRPKYLSGDLLVELTCELILFKNCVKPGFAVFWVTSRSCEDN
jgi:hypothetical protein